MKISPSCAPASARIVFQAWWIFASHFRDSQVLLRLLSNRAMVHYDILYLLYCGSQSLCTPHAGHRRGKGRTWSGSPVLTTPCGRHLPTSIPCYHDAAVRPTYNVTLVMYNILIPPGVEGRAGPLSFHTTPHSTRLPYKWCTGYVLAQLVGRWWAGQSGCPFRISPFKDKPVLFIFFCVGLFLFSFLFFLGGGRRLVCSFSSTPGGTWRRA